MSGSIVEFEARPKWVVEFGQRSNIRDISKREN
jgi:hypothetical protein